MYIGKGYISKGLFKLNVMTIIPNINKVSSFVYMFEFFNVWHGRLGHANFNIMHRLVNLDIYISFILI